MAQTPRRMRSAIAVFCRYRKEPVLPPSFAVCSRVKLNRVRRFTCILRLIAVVGLAAGPQSRVFAEDLSGHWESTSPLRDGVLGLALDAAGNDTGNWVASLSDPVRKVFGIRVSDIEVRGDKLSFTSPDLPGIPAYELKFGRDSLEGTVTVQGTALPLTMKRTGKANVRVTPLSPPVSKELEGDWEGALPEAGHTVAFHFRNQQDNSAEATVDNSDLHGAQKFVRVNQMGSDIELTLFVFGASYKRTLSSDGSQLTGTWTPNPGAPPLPLNMRKK